MAEFDSMLQRLWRYHEQLDRGKTLSQDELRDIQRIFAVVAEVMKPLLDSFYSAMFTIADRLDQWYESLPEEVRAEMDTLAAQKAPTPPRRQRGSNRMVAKGGTIDGQIQFSQIEPDMVGSVGLDNLAGLLGQPIRHRREGR